MATPMDVWQTDITLRVPGADPAAIEIELKGALREFYRWSGSWIRKLAPLNIKTDKSQYDFNPAGDNERILYTLRADISGLPVRLIDKQPPSGVWPGRGVWLVSTGLAQIFPTPTEDIDDGLEMVVSLTFDKVDCHQVPEYVQVQWFDTILDGATGRLMQHVKRPYTNPTMALYYGRRFRNGMKEARDVARRSWGFAESGWQFPSSWTASSRGRGRGSDRSFVR